MWFDKNMCESLENYIWTDFNQKLISVNTDIHLPFTGFHDLLNVREEKMHVRLAESVE